MGEARRRGTFEQRKEQACIRLQNEEKTKRESQQVENHKSDKEIKNSLVLSKILDKAYNTTDIK